ncbi:hypothetical protein FraEuI1c_0199 [Pseudofrankia inefficax]|uniref:Uncharacterized protein n=1 Tax=Pseudofrankia inefficax (strain DSM 45817 / CECT 9037 / DDB 130130 / EuI1c) TaxID=298654 RepID=E3J4W8_PSEI1|nr:hypothetical protein FraEuI1c_0199 [Pseudofrankia inefficax]
MVARPFEESSAPRAEPPGPPEARREDSFAPAPDQLGPPSGAGFGPAAEPPAASGDTVTGAVVVRRGPAQLGELAAADDRTWRRSAAGDYRATRGSHRLGDVDPARDADAWKVGFSPSGEALPDALTDVLLRGSHWVRSAQRVETLRRERSAAIAAHVEAQLAAFLELCAEAELVPPVTLRVVRDVPRLARHRGEGRPRAALPTDPPGDPSLTAAPRRGRPSVVRATRIGLPDLAEGPTTRPLGRRGAEGDQAHRTGPDRAGRRGRADGDPPSRSRRGGRDSAGGGPAPARWHGRNQLTAWPLLYWRCESFPSAGRSLHLFVEPGGRTFEGREDPAPLDGLGRQVRVWPVDAPSIVEGMAEVDARRCALHLVDGMARLLWRAGVGL